MPTRLCCPECFDDRFLRDGVFPFNSTETGTCGFCETHDVALLKPEKLLEHFEPLALVYRPEPEGKSLVEWMKDDWLLFDKLDVAHAKELLVEIFDDGEIVRKSYVPSDDSTSANLERWKNLRNEIKYRNRWWFSDEKGVDSDGLERLLNKLEVEVFSGSWFRARICTDDEELPATKMGAPPKELTSNGRANPAGIPYLYLASSPETAVAEIRPHTGSFACVGEFEISTIRAVDLREPRKLVSPFGMGDIGEIAQLRVDLPLLEGLGEELTHPVLPHAAAIDYIPSQYLCEFIKSRDFDGVIYRSSVSDGFNLALFNPEVGSCKSVTGYKVRKVSVDVEPFPKAPPPEI